MSDSDDPTRAVWDVLDELRKVVLDRNETGSTRLDDVPTDSRPIWRRLEKALRDSAEIMHDPRPGQGLASVWLRAVWHRAAKIEEAAEDFSNGWSNAQWQDSDDPQWLATTGWESGCRLSALAGRWKRGIRSLRNLETKPLARLRQLAADLDDKEQHEAIGAEQVGELILQAVNELDVAGNWLRDDAFREHIVKNVDFLPAIAGPPYLLGLSSKALTAWIDQLEPKQLIDEFQPANGLELQPPKPYPTPETYARDQWIFENIQNHTCRSLSLELKRQSVPKKWIVISSRNGLKVAADRYANHHGFDPRRFSKGSIPS